jgi:hypothetical protein
MLRPGDYVVPVEGVRAGEESEGFELTRTAWVFNA